MVNSQEKSTKNIKCYTFLTGLMYNAAMKKGVLKEEDVVKISITAKRAGDDFDDDLKIFLEKLMAKKKRMRSN